MTAFSLVRSAVSQDEPEIWRLFRMMHEENALFTLSERKVQYHLTRCLHPESIGPDDWGPRGLIGVIGRKYLQGVIMLVLGSPWYTEEIIMDDCINYVDIDHRRSNHATALIAWAKHMVDQIRISGHPGFRMVVGVLSSQRTAAKIRFYERQMTPIGAFFVYPPPDDFTPLKRTFEAN